ncbi:hypothetical protein FB45DRAFT_1094399 [Roridomyces roridus]|uniref:F-box domain-containing protein n=1 Tax=Roridomyces roridus TaxID=1738132 RepID=A0AAD7BGW7_9AGAR|nr:hypothetical protein FB45DRAFT_1094399 [Roridomyces roridus]
MYSVQISLPPTPQLRDVHLRSMKASDICLPWSQLTSLSLYGITIPNVVAILRLTPNIVTVHVSSVIQDSRPPGTIIELSHLRTITTFSLDLLPHLKAPALEELDIHGFDQNTVYVLKYFIERSRSPIHTIRLREGTVGAVWQAEGCMRLVPLLRHFSLSGVSCGSREWKTVLGRIAEREILPAVESLTFTDCGIPIQYIATMLTARAEREEGRITAFRYIPCEDDGDVDESLAMLRELRSRGMLIDIGWGDMV